MKHRGFEITNEKYFEVEKNAMDFINKVVLFFNINIENITFKQIKEYCEKELGIIYEGYPLSDISYMIGGVAIKNEHGVIIGYNSNLSLSPERQNFSMMHETYHILYHMDTTQPFQQHYSNFFERSTYTFEETIREIEADFGSSIFLLNNKALIQQILNNRTYLDICYHFEISKLALKLRLINFLYYNCNLSYSASNLYVERYFEGYNTPILKMIKNYAGIQNNFLDIFQEKIFQKRKELKINCE